jgi:signal transduction histidine kinase
MYYEGFVVDITKRKQAEDLIKESETLLKSYQMIAGLGSYILDIGTGNWKSSNILDNIFGIDENYEKNIEGWLSMIHPDWQETMQKYFTEEVVGKGQRFNKEYKITRISNKEVRWVHGLGELEYDNYGKPCRMLGTIMDITTRKKSEEKLKENEEKLSTLFGAMTEMVVLHEVVFDEQGKAINYRITDCNKAFTQITGISREFAIGKLATEVYQSETPPYLEEFTQVGITGQPYEYTTYYTPMDKHFIISVVCPRSGTFATITTDITDIKQIEEIVSAKNKELENYLYVASHDLRSPLVNIQGFSQRLNKQATQLNEIISVTDMSHDQKSEIEKIVLEGFPKTLEFIYTNINKMDKLITGLLQISRTGRMKMNIQKIDMNFLLDKITKSYSFQMEEIKGQFKMNELSGCYGDPDMLSQLFSNIIENAIKYRDENKKLIIRISSQNMYKKVLYLVEDNGIGISQRHSEKIWDVFYRVNAQGNEKGEGIGLSIVKRIVDKHKGKIWMKSVEGEGTTFFIELLDKTFNEHV